MGKHSLFRRAAALATAVLGLAAFTPAVQAAPTGPISFHAPDGLIVSTGNVYFTSHDAFSGVVWRTGQDSIAGQELPIYRVIGARFGDIVFAQVDGVWWGYFFSAKAGVVSIKRVPLTGEAPAIDLKTGLRDIDIVNSHRNLVTDGAFLYWQDVNSVHRMPIRGGADVVLDRAAPNTPTAGLALRNGFLIYASVADIRYVATNGSSITNPQFRTLATGASVRNWGLV